MGGVVVCCGMIALLLLIVMLLRVIRRRGVRDDAFLVVGTNRFMCSRLFKGTEGAGAAVVAGPVLRSRWGHGVAAAAGVCGTRCTSNGGVARETRHAGSVS